MKPYLKALSLFLAILPAAGCYTATEDARYAEASARLEKVPLIPRTVLFGNPDKAAAQISADGKHISFLAPVDGVMNVWVGTTENPDDARPVTKDTKRGIRSYFWAWTNDRILYTQDKGGDENWHVYSTHIATRETIDLTPIDGVQARINEVSRKFPKEILVGLNDRSKQLHDIYRVNIETGDRELVIKNEGFLGFMTDDDYRVRMAFRMMPDGGMEYQIADAEGGFKTFYKIPHDDMMTSGPEFFSKDGKTLFVKDSIGRNTAALFAMDLNTREKTLIIEDRKADIGGVMRNPQTKKIEAVSINYKKNRWEFMDESIQKEFQKLSMVDTGEVNITDRTWQDDQWIVAFTKDDGPVKYYHWDRTKQKARFLFTNRKALEGVTLSKMHPVIIQSRDGLDLVSYLTLPPGTSRGGGIVPKKPIPMVLFVHGGPWGRDVWRYHPYHQALANRGYAVLSVNFRGSTGFGKEFINAGDLEWGAKMHDDLIDAVNWAASEGIADPKKVAIMGGSYGGYATLAGLTMTPKTFACGVDIVGPSNIITLLEAIPPYWKPFVDLWKKRVGDWTTEEGRAFLRSRSPITYVDQIERPLLIGQGANDPRVKQAESDQIVEVMNQKNIPVTYVLFPDEGHGFRRPENSMAFFAVTEAFLAEHLGGRYEPITASTFEGSSITVPSGASLVPGLGTAVKN